MSSVDMAYRAGSVIGAVIEGGAAAKLIDAVDAALLTQAAITRSQYRAHVYLLLVAASLHAIHSASLDPTVENAAAAGLLDWCKQQSTEIAEVLSSEVDDALEDYAGAFALEGDRGDAPLSDLEYAFADRLFNLGQQNDERAAACARLALSKPLLWKTASFNAMETLRDAGLIPRVS
jgi:hypothetical protein